MQKPVGDRTSPLRPYHVREPIECFHLLRVGGVSRGERTVTEV